MIGFSEYLRRRAHVIFKKKPRPDGRKRDTEFFFEIAGRTLDRVRDQIVTLLRQMVAGSAGGEYLVRHGRNAGLNKLPLETDEQFRAKVANPWAHWRYAGSPSRLEEHATLLGYEIEVEEVFRDYAEGEPRTRWSDLRVTVLDLGMLPQRDFLHELRRRRPARSIMQFELGPELQVCWFDDDGGSWDDLGQFDDWTVGPWERFDDGLGLRFDDGGYFDGWRGQAEPPTYAYFDDSGLLDDSGRFDLAY
ncbi:MAG: hypothetical protein P9M14_04970 [Candidatus Alcyoniella australis]|nr:hypothetical protein [Candidatus Alcyoniella australis]